jgi:Rrf2 family transcriptional regulator, cysteine metabolism repressor
LEGFGVINVSDRSRAAVSALAELARRADPAPVPILEISEARHIPLHVLEQLFSALRRSGILKSQRGVKGGYCFLRPAREVTVLEVVECVDGPLRPSADAPGNAAQELWNEAQTRLAEVLGAVTIAEMVEREARHAGELMFHI